MSVRLYIGNATKQNQEFVYRLPEQSGARVQTIPIGQQVQITGELSSQEIDAIVSQHRKYGLTEATAIDSADVYTGIVYSVGKPIPADKLTRAMIHNTRVLQARGKEIRRDAALAENQLAEGDVPGRLNKLEMSIQEENHDDRDPEPAIAEGVRVQRDEDNPAPRGNRRQNQTRGNRRRAA